MSSLIDLVQEQTQTEHDEALVSYRSILGRNDNPKPTDGKELRRAMMILGFDADRLSSDLATLRQAANLERESVAFTPAHAGQHDAAWSALTEHNAETERLAREREGERVRLDVEADLLSNRQTQARDAGRRLTELRRQHRDLFGLSPEPEVKAEFSQTHNRISDPPESTEGIRSRQPIELDLSVLPKPGAAIVPTSVQRLADHGAGLE